MSITNNGYLSAAKTALGVADDLGAPVVEQLLDNVAVSSIRAYQISDKGKFVVLATVAGTVRPVAASTGDVKLYSDASAVMNLARTSNLPAGSVIEITKHGASGTVGDPVTTLKSQHKSAVKEAATAAASVTSVGAKVSAAAALNWNTDPEGSATRAEYNDLAARQSSVQEWKSAVDARVATLSAALTAAGIDPNTYLPIP